MALLKEKARKITILGQKRKQITSRRKGIKYKNKNLAYVPTIVDSEKHKVIKVPPNLNVYCSEEDNLHYEETIEFINGLKRKVSDDFILDFTECEDIKAAALVLLFATVDEITDELDIVCRIRLSKNVNVNSLIKNSDFKRMGNNTRSGKPLSHYQKLPIIKGVDADNTEEIVDFIKEKYYKNNMSPLEELKLSNAVFEAIENVGNHAYPQIDSESKRWWLLVEPIEDQFFLAIYDKGVGIPKTILKRKWFEQTFKEMYPEEYESIRAEIAEKESFIDYLKRKAVGHLDDETLLKISMMGDVSGTTKKGRGQGSKSIKTLIGENNYGKLWVFSNEGLYILKHGDEKPTTLPLDVSFPGTLIQWNIRLT